jgi:hypothetical protein
LTAKKAAVAIFLAIVVLVGSFEVGSRAGQTRGRRLGFRQGQASYTAGALSEIEKARGQRPATHLVENLLAEPAGTASDARPIEIEGQLSSGPTRWVKGNTYIVGQEFSADRLEDALQAQEFLTQNGVPTELVRLPGGAMQLLTTQGYNRKDPTQRQMADELLAKVHRIGERYFAAGGGYRLRGYFKTRTENTW